MNNQKTEYKLEGGSIITATSPTDFITQLRESSKFDSQCTDQEYMINFSKRREVQTGAIIRTDSPDNFVKDLMDTGYIE